MDQDQQSARAGNPHRKTGGCRERPSRGLRLFPQAEFSRSRLFCEAKKPSRDLSNAADYFQLVRYGSGARTPVGVLTNFYEFHVIDCRYQPSIDKSYPSAQIEKYAFADFLDKEQFGKFYWLFSYEAVRDGKLRDFAKTLPKQRGTGKAKLTAEEAKPVDEAFLTKLEEYRLTLAKAFKKADDTLTAELLTEATQKVIDRLVFMRLLEDKSSKRIVSSSSRTRSINPPSNRRRIRSSPIAARTFPTSTASIRLSKYRLKSWDRSTSDS